MYIYIVENDSDRQYIGITKELFSTINKIRNGKYKYTNCADLNWKLIYYWQVDSFIKASKFKRLLKSKKLKAENWALWLKWLVATHKEWDSWIETQISILKTTDHERKMQLQMYGELSQ